VTTSGTAAFRTRAFAKRLGVSDRWLHHLEATGQIPPAQRDRGGRWWSADAVEQAVAAYRARTPLPRRSTHGRAVRRRADLLDLGRAFALCWGREPLLASQLVAQAVGMERDAGTAWLAQQLRSAAKLVRGAW
jgi:hypothetical protein